MKNLGNIFHTFINCLNKDKVYLLTKEDFSVNMELYIPVGNSVKYRHLVRIRNEDSKRHEHNEATYSTLLSDLHNNFVKMNQYSHRMCLYEFNNEDEVNKFLLTEKLSK